MTETWYLWRDGAHEAALNMALDEALLESAPARGVPLLRVYAWDRPAVSIGYTQKRIAAPAHGYAVVRRPTGGGVVYHGEDLTYSVVVHAGHWLAALDRLESYAAVNRAVLASLAACDVHGALAHDEIPRAIDRRTMVCFRTPTRYDIVRNGEKIAGSAQRRTENGLLHQGSIHSREFTAESRARLVDSLAHGFQLTLGVGFAPFVPSPELQTAAERLAAERYRTLTWTHRDGLAEHTNNANLLPPQDAPRTPCP